VKIGKAVRFAIVAGFASIMVALAVYNFICNDNFFTMSLHNIAMLSVSIGIAYYLVQRKIDERRYQDGQIKVIERIILDIQSCLSDDALSHNWGDNLMRSRALSNKIQTLKKICSSFNEQLLRDIAYIEANFERLKELYEDVDAIYIRKGMNPPADQVAIARRLSNNVIAKSYDVWASAYTT